NSPEVLQILGFAYLRYFADGGFRVGITGADDPTRIAIQSAVVRALQHFTPEPVNVRWEIASQ
ncbi:MAG: hypothetical protein WBE42_27310, partial [Pseudolabrys sp.]